MLSACLTSAVAHGYAASNPISKLPKSEKPKPRKREAAYFENAELRPLFAQIPDHYRVLFQVALSTGMRQGEIMALTWGDVDLVDHVIRVRHNYTAGRLTDPKNHERRDVDITNKLAETLTNWKAEQIDFPTNDMLVFPGDSRTGYLSTSTLTKRVLYPAMTAAGIPREDPTGEQRVFHSFRHTFSKIALEKGREIYWLSRHLGHSSFKVTTDLYGHWERGERKRQVAELEGAFDV